jgi:hypothetical protein
MIPSPRLRAPARLHAMQQAQVRPAAVRPSRMQLRAGRFRHHPAIVCKAAAVEVSYWWVGGAACAGGGRVVEGRPGRRREGAPGARTAKPVPVCAVQAPAQSGAQQAFPTPPLEALARELQAAADAKERTRLLLGYGRRLPPFPEAARRDANRVMGCTAQVCSC